MTEIETAEEAINAINGVIAGAEPALIDEELEMLGAVISFLKNCEADS